MWNYLKTASKPILMYGTGDAAERIYEELCLRGIKLSGIFASDGFVRNRSFLGFPVISYCDAVSGFGNFIVLLAFGTHLPEVLSNIKRIEAEQELYAPDLPVAGGELFLPEYAEKHRTELEAVRNILADDQSRKVFDNTIEYKLSGKLSHLYAAESFDAEMMGLINLGAVEDYVDLGAYTGDTLKQFLEITGGCYSSIVAAEPDGRNFRKLSEYAGSLPGCSLYNIAIWNKEGSLEFSKGRGRGGAKNRGKTISIPCTSVDNILSGRKASYIKMDLEGAEAKAIEGSRLTIQKWKPKMLVAAYHRTEDIFSIPLQVLAINPNYKVYLRHSPCVPAWELNYIFVS